MRLFFLEETPWADINGSFKAGQDAFFQPTEEVKKLVEDGKAIKINDSMKLTETNREFILIQNQEAKQKKTKKAK